MAKESFTEQVARLQATNAERRARRVAQWDAAGVYTPLDNPMTSFGTSWSTLRGDKVEFQRCRSKSDHDHVRLARQCRYVNFAGAELFEALANEGVESDADYESDSTPHPLRQRRYKAPQATQTAASAARQPLPSAPSGARDTQAKTVSKSGPASQLAPIPPFKPAPAKPKPSVSSHSTTAVTTPVKRKASANVTPVTKRLRESSPASSAAASADEKPVRTSLSPVPRRLRSLLSPGQRSSLGMLFLRHSTPFTTRSRAWCLR